MKPVDAVAIALALCVVVNLYVKKRRAVKIPPGPKGYPIVGNLLDWPKEKEWVTFAQWREQYGDTVYVNLLGKSVLVVNSARAASELLDKKGAIYSDRPSRPMMELAGIGHGVASLPLGPRHARMRAMLNRTLGSRDAVARFVPIAESKIRAMFRRTLLGVEPLRESVERGTAAIVMRISFGYDVLEEGDDPMFHSGLEFLRIFAKLLQPRPYLVDIIPTLKYVPKWFPGAGFHKFADYSRTRIQELLHAPYDWARAQMDAGTAVHSFAYEHLNDDDMSPEKMDEVRWVGGSIFVAGFDTSTSTILSFFLCMTLYPEIQKRAQEEIETVVGQDRLPTLEDRKKLPYLNALILELFRWGPAAPQGVAHRLREDDTHDGYYIPKNTIVMANIWGMLHDPETYKDPMAFNPSRFLDEDGHIPEQDPTAFNFGFGRRICPGMILAETDVFLACAIALATLNISMAKDDQGAPHVPVVDYSSGMISHPAPFPCVITAKNNRAKALLDDNDLLTA